MNPRQIAGQESQTSSESSTPAALCSDALAHLQAGRLLDAQVSCQKALAIEPAYADALHLMGRIALDMGQNDHAVVWLARAMASAPGADYACSLGTALRRLGRLEEALLAFDRAVQLKPDDAQGWIGLADVLFDLQQANDSPIARCSASTHAIGMRRAGSAISIIWRDSLWKHSPVSAIAMSCGRTMRRRSICDRCFS
jgi:tetratricopeptide (TPR) repeat protein